MTAFTPPTRARMSFDFSVAPTVHSVVIPRNIAARRSHGRTLIRVSMPFVVLLAAHAGRTNPDVACCVMQERLQAERNVDLEALNDAIAGFAPMLPSAFAVREFNGTSLQLDSLRMRLETAPVLDIAAPASSGKGKMSSVMMDAVFATSHRNSFDVAFHPMKMPANHHVLTEILDRRSSQALPKTWFGTLKNPIRFNPDDVSMPQHH